MLLAGRQTLGTSVITSFTLKGWSSGKYIILIKMAKIFWNALPGGWLKLWNHLNWVRRPMKRFSLFSGLLLSNLTVSILPSPAFIRHFGQIPWLFRLFRELKCNFKAHSSLAYFEFRSLTHLLPKARWTSDQKHERGLPVSTFGQRERVGKGGQQCDYLTGIVVASVSPAWEAGVLKAWSSAGGWRSGWIMTAMI